MRSKGVRADVAEILRERARDEMPARCHAAATMMRDVHDVTVTTYATDDIRVHSFSA